MVTELISIKNIAFAYEKKEVFSNLSLSLESGEICCLIGSNGCGKTTLLDCILGIHEVKGGEIFVENKNIKDYLRHELARKISYVPQIHEITFPYKVLQAVVMGRAAYLNFFSAPGKEDEDIAMDCLRKVGMDHLADKPYTQISGGEMQLVMLARALAQDTNIIIMDEPTAHLDLKNELLFLETVADLVTNHKVSVLIATHMPNHSFYFENKGLNVTLAMMSDGNIQEKGRPGEILTESNIRRLYKIDARLLEYTLEDGRTLKQIVPLSTKY
jgi:iron complex transport system ATP-binding protein